MFNLEKSIDGWRNQMLAVGIQSPTPLEELELHLREEIERQTRSGSGDEEAFDLAIQAIGPIDPLHREFRKIDEPNLGWTILSLIGWSVAAGALIYGVVGWDLHWNFFSFHAKWDREAAESFLVILAAETGIWFLAKQSCHRAGRILSLLICLFLAWFGIFECLPVEQKIHVQSDGSPMGGFIAAILADRKASPLWWRGGLATVMLLPLIFWSGQVWRQAMQKHRPPAAVESAGE